MVEHRLTKEGSVFKDTSEPVREKTNNFSENKDADQLCNYCTADLLLCFRLCMLLVFLCIWLTSFSDS